MEKLNMFVCERFDSKLQKALIQAADKQIQVERTTASCDFSGSCRALDQCAQACGQAGFSGLVVCGESGNVMRVLQEPQGQVACRVIANYYDRDLPEANAELRDGADLIRQNYKDQTHVKEVSPGYLALALKSIVYEYAMKSMKRYAEDEIYRLNILCMDHETVVDMAEEMAYQSGEEELIRYLLQCFETLLYPCECHYYSLEPGGGTEFPKHVKEIIGGGNKYRVWRDKGLLVIKLAVSKEVMGAVEIQGNLPSQYIDKQLDLLLHLTNVAALCLSNIRKDQQLASSESKYKHLSMSDSLTGIYNRRYFHKRLGKIKEDISYWPVAIFVCDIDKLKHTNDNKGHLVGDKLIVKAAEVLKKSFPEGTICRIGGDEFSVILDSVDYEQVTTHYHQLKSNLELMNQADGEPVLSLSVGYAYCDDFKSDLEALFHEADLKMYQEKERHSISHL